MSENENNKITVKILFFGAARDAAGSEEVDISIDSPVCVSGVKNAIFSRYEGLAPYSQSLMIAVNREYATNETAVVGGDEIAFLPPVSGG